MALFSLMFEDLLDAGVVDKSGAWYSYGKERIGQGRENAKLYLKDHAEIAEEVEVMVKQHLGIAPKEEEAAAEE